MHISHQKERFSIAYVRALAAQAACYCDEPEVDDDSVDLRVYAKLDCGVETNRPEMALQLKCTATPDFRRAVFTEMWILALSGRLFRCFQ